ncbi:hypothetical protein FRC03_011270 [Tulasnella sp. 419]|nr:hypothetical protein FRC03_011270 [Tulasnella sp. 419]
MRVLGPPSCDGLPGSTLSASIFAIRNHKPPGYRRGPATANDETYCGTSISVLLLQVHRELECQSSLDYTSVASSTILASMSVPVKLLHARHRTVSKGGSAHAP